MPTTAKRKKETGPRAARTRGGHEPTGTSQRRRIKVADQGLTARGDRTRRAIIDAARRVFERIGYVDARVSDIVAEAGIAHGSFYTYFASKVDVFKEIENLVGAQINEAVAHAPEDAPGDALANLEHANRRYLAVHWANARFMTLVDQVATIDPDIHRHRVHSRRRHVARVAKGIARLQERGQADPGTDAEATAEALVAMLAAFAHWARLSPERYDLDTAAKTVTTIWIRAIGMTSKPRPAGRRSVTRR